MFEKVRKLLDSPNKVDVEIALELMHTWHPEVIYRFFAIYAELYGFRSRTRQVAYPIVTRYWGSYGSNIRHVLACGLVLYHAFQYLHLLKPNK